MAGGLEVGKEPGRDPSSAEGGDDLPGSEAKEVVTTNPSTEAAPNDRPKETLVAASEKTPKDVPEETLEEMAFVGGQLERRLRASEATKEPVSPTAGAFEPSSSPAPPAPSENSSSTPSKPMPSADTDATPQQEPPNRLVDLPLPPVPTQESQHAEPPGPIANPQPSDLAIVSSRNSRRASEPGWTRFSTRLSLRTYNPSGRPIKYATGKLGRIELVPQPSDDPNDPLNWPRWRKELNLVSLLLMVALTGVLKTVFVTVNSQLAETFFISYTAAAALTGAPLILAAAAGLVALVGSRVWGKRPFYLVALALVFVGTVWNSHVGASFGSCMAARVFQGLGWGVFDALVLGSIQDTYFEHERRIRVAIYSTVSVSTTWGPPLIGGVASGSSTGFEMQFAILSVFFILAVPAIVLGAPETAFDRVSSTSALELPTTADTPTSGEYIPPIAARPTLSTETLKAYLARMKPLSYTARTGSRDELVALILQAPRAFVAPTIFLLLLVSLLPFCVLWSLSSSLSLIFSPLPFLISPGCIGSLMTGPWLLATATIAAFEVIPAVVSLRPAWHARCQFSEHMPLYALASGTILSSISTLALGLHVAAALTPSPSDPAAATTSVFALGYLGPRVDLAAVSALLGFAAAGAYVLDAMARPLIRRSTQFTSANLTVELRAAADMNGALGALRSLCAGVVVIAAPNGVWNPAGLRAFCDGAAVAQILVASLVAVVWWRWEENVRRWDGQIMGLVDMSMLKRGGSFLNID